MDLHGRYRDFNSGVSRGVRGVAKQRVVGHIGLFLRIDVDVLISLFRKHFCCWWAAAAVVPMWLAVDSWGMRNPPSKKNAGWRGYFVVTSITSQAATRIC